MLIKRRRLVTIASGATGLMAITGGMPARAASPATGEQTYFFLVFSDPVAGQEEAYARWFAGPHIRNMANLPHVASVQRYTDARVELRRAPTKPPLDLVVYTIRTADPDELQDAIRRQANAGGAWPDGRFALVRTVTYRAVQPRMDGVGGEPADARGGDPTTFLVTAFLDAVAGQDGAFNAWYDTVHEPELLANRGVISGIRTARSEVQMGPSDIQSQYLMMITVVTSDLPAVFRGMLAGGPPSPALDRTRGYGYNYRAVDTSP